MGIGFGAAPHVLEDFFGVDKHGNFHSLYITTLAEIGLPAFLVLIFMLCGPIIARKSATRIVMAIMIFNVSYQVHIEPMFWLILFVVWSAEIVQYPKLRFLTNVTQPHSVADSAM